MFRQSTSMHQDLLWRSAPALLLVLAGCSKYQSYRDGGFGDEIAATQRWEVQLPYASGQELIIEDPSANELLLYESKGRFHLTKIPLDGNGRPGLPMHRELERGDSCERLDPGQLLVVADRRKRKYVTLVDSRTLVPRFSANFPFEAEEGGPTDPSIISFPGQRRVEDTLVFYRSRLEIKRHTWSDYQYEYSVPYVGTLKYDINLLDVTKGSVRSFTGLDLGSVSPLNLKLVASQDEALREESFGSLVETRQAKLDQYIYVLDQFFLVDGGKTLIFSLENLDETERLYYTLEPLRGAGSLRWRLPSDLVAKYPNELVLTERDAWEKLRSRDLTVSGQKYSPEHFALLAGGLVVVARATWAISGKDEYAPSREVLGVRFSGTEKGGLEKAWEFPLSHSYRVGDLIEDRIRGAVFLPDRRRDGRFFAAGLSATDGRPVAGFPANFKLDGIDKGDKRQVRIVGTAIDFARNLLYLHDQQNHRIVCAGLRRDNGQASR